MTSAAVPGFLPSRHGLRFANRWPPLPALRLGWRGALEVGVGTASSGLCGGMCLTVLDLFAARVAPPPDGEPPAPGSPRWDYLVRRQLDSLDLLRVPIRFYAEQLVAWLERLGILRTRSGGPSWVRRVVAREWPAIRADIDAGRPSVVGLIRAASPDPRRVGLGHQVLAYGYDVGPDRLTLRIYDPNHPLRDDVELRLVLGPAAGGEPGRTARLEYSTGEPLVAFFREPYRARDPAPWR